MARFPTISDPFASLSSTLYDRGAFDREQKQKAILAKEANERALAEQAVIDQAGGSLLNDFLSNQQVKTIFEQDPRFATDLTARYQFAQNLADNNKKLFSDPNKVYDDVYRGVLNQGGTMEQATAAADRARTSIFGSTLDPKIAKELLIQPDAPKAGNSTNISVGADGTVRSTSGSSGGTQKLLFDRIGEKDADESWDRWQDRMGVENGRINLPVLGRVTDWGDTDVTKADINNIRRALDGKLSVRGAQYALESLIDSSDGTTGLTPAQLRNPDEGLINDLIAKGQEYERGVQERTINSRTGLTSNNTGGAGTAASLAAGNYQDYLDFVNANNADIMSRLGYAQNPSSDRIALLANELGIAPRDLASILAPPQPQTAPTGSQPAPGGQTPPPAASGSGNTPPPAAEEGGAEELLDQVTAALGTPESTGPNPVAAAGGAIDDILDNAAANSADEGGLVFPLLNRSRNAVSDFVSNNVIEPTAPAGNAILDRLSRAQDITARSVSEAISAAEQVPEQLLNAQPDATKIVKSRITTDAQRRAFEYALHPATPQHERDMIFALILQGEDPQLNVPGPIPARGQLGRPTDDLEGTLELFSRLF